MPINVQHTFYKTITKTLHALPIHELLHFGAYVGILAAVATIIATIYIIRRLRRTP